MSKRAWAIAGFVLLGILLVAGVASLVYYRSLRSTPQYSLALLIDAAQRDDRQQIDEVVDINAVVEDFVPQITSKAVELYGRGQPPEVLRSVARLALPLLPAVKERARAELPRVIRERTEKFSSIPFFAMVLGAEEYLDISIDGDVALVKSKLPDHPLEITMRRNGERWRIVGVREEQVATAIARKIGQEIMAIAVGGRRASGDMNIGSITELIRQAEELIK